MIALPLQISLRYSRARKGHAFLSFMSAVSFLGLTLGVVALTVVVSVMNGFDRELRQRILGAVPHVTLETGNVDETLDWAEGNDTVRGAAPFLLRQGVMIAGASNRLVALYGIEAEREEAVSILPQNMVAGSLGDLAREGGAVLGRPLAWQLGLGVGDTATVIVPVPAAAGSSIRPRLMRVVVRGLFEVDSEVDYGVVLLRLPDLMDLVGTEPTVRLALNDVFAAPAVSQRAISAGVATSARDWTDDYGDFFDTVRMEKNMMFILLAFVVAIAAFNIVSSLSMMVKEKHFDIAVFRTLGLTPSRIMLIFLGQGAIIGLLGVGLGLALGVPLAIFIPDIVAFFEDLLGARMLAGTYFDELPTDVRAADLVVIAGVSLVISFIATLYPARQAAALQPAAILRYETR